MELKWDDAPLDEPVTFSKDVFDKFSLAPTIEELWTALQRSSAVSANVKEDSKTKSADPPSAAKQAENNKNSPHTNIAAPECQEASAECENSLDKNAQKEGFPEPRVPYPCYSSLARKEREMCLKSLRTRGCNINKHLAGKVKNELEEFMKYLQEVSRVCADDYKFLPPGAARYSEEYFKACLEHMNYYPQVYNVQEITSLTGGKFRAGISLNFEKQLLGLGNVEMVEKVIVPENKQLVVDYETISAETPPFKKASCSHTPISSDSNAEKLSAWYEPHVCLAKEAFLQLLNNGADYAESWELPVWVKVSTEKGCSERKTVFIDPPLLKMDVSCRERSLLVHEESIKLAYKKTGSKPLLFLTTDDYTKEEDFATENTRTRAIFKFDDTNIDFDVDVTDLEMFGESCHPTKDVKSHSKPKKLSQSQTQGLPLPKEGLDQQTSLELLSIGTSTPKNIPLAPSTLPKKEELEEEEEEEEAKTSTQDSSLSESDDKVQNPVSEENLLGTRTSAQQCCATKSPPSKRAKLNFLNSSDSEEERLIIDYPASHPGKKQLTSPGSENIADAVTCSADTQTSGPGCPMSPTSLATGAKKGAKRPRVSRDCDQLGQILRMQNAMLKSTTVKNQGPLKAQTPDCKSPEAKESSNTLSLVKQCVSSYLKSREGQDNEMAAAAAAAADVAFPCTPRKRLLREDLLVSAEDEKDYEAPSEGNSIYKLYSLLDVLLMVRSSVHIAHPRNDQDTFRAVPVHVLPKLEYQLCYGAESLTHKEACQIWAERLLHSSTVSFIGRINAHTSKLVQLHELPSDWIQNTSCDFKPARCLNTLYHILRRVMDLPEGRYLLTHKPGEAVVAIYKTSDEKKTSRSTYDLQAVHSGPPEVRVDAWVPWVPLDPFHVLPFHRKHSRPPCTFPPRPPPKAREVTKRYNASSAPPPCSRKTPHQNQGSKWKKKKNNNKKKKMKSEQNMKGGGLFSNDQEDE